MYVQCLNVITSANPNNALTTHWKELLPAGVPSSPTWSSMYTSPVSKRAGDIQWRLAHYSLTSNVFLKRLNLVSSDECPFCHQSEDVFHAYVGCQRLIPLFKLLKLFFQKLGFRFSFHYFIFCIPVSNKNVGIEVANFLLAEAKLAIYITRKRMISAVNSQECSALLAFKGSVCARLKMEFLFYRESSRINDFIDKWCKIEVLCRVEGENLFLLY